MSSIRETLFALVFNAFLQIGFFALVTAVFSRLVARARAKYQYLFYLAVLALCLTTPVVNTLWPWHPSTVAEKPLQQDLSQPADENQHLWLWQNHLREHQQLAVGPKLEEWIVAIWGLLALYRLFHFGRAVHRVHQLRRHAVVLSLDALGMAGQFFEQGRGVTLLQSAAVDDPVTVGVFHPSILLPSKVLPQLREQDLAAILAHEYGHIRRRDFLVHILCELLSLPVAWHPGIRYLVSKISQTRELACDDDAAVRLGHRRLYARTLLRLASLCLHTPRGNTVALGIFDGDNLENRIMMLTENQHPLPRAAVIWLTLALSIPFGAGAVLAHATSLQAGSTSTNLPQAFAGTWHWMFEGKSFSTMVLVRDGSGFSGSVTPSRIALKDDGGLNRADPSENNAPLPIAQAQLKGSALLVKVLDGNQPFEFMVTLKDETHAEIHPVGAPPNMKPILAEKAH